MSIGLEVGTAPLWVALFISVSAAVALGHQMRRLGVPTVPTHPAPRQIALEFAWTAARARTLLQSWGPPGVAKVRAQVLWDFPFVLAYLVAGISAILLAGAALAALAPPLSSLAQHLATIWVAVGVLDIVENVALLRVLGGSGATLAQPLASFCAFFKFLLAVPPAAFAVTGLTFAICHHFGVV